MEDSTLWWLAAGAAVIVELLTGTFYLLMLTLGLAAGALAAHAGLGLPAQLLVGADRSVNLDVGETVHIEAWQSDGTASVKYRGAQWTAIHRPGATPVPGAHRVAELVGNRLLVDRI